MQVCSAVRFIIDRVSGGGILDLDSPSTVSGLSVFDVLTQKHPEPIVKLCHLHLYLVTLYHKCLT